MIQVGSGERIAFVVHGILGAGRNWRGVATTLSHRFPKWRFALVDLRNHAGGERPAGPHTLAACADDLARAAESTGQPDLVIGHSFGGKVALTWAERHATPQTRGIQVLDCAPGRSDAKGADTLAVLEAVFATPTPAPQRGVIRDFLKSRGVPDPIIAWLATSLTEGPEGWVWGYDLPGVRAMLDDFFTCDLWPFLLRPPPCPIRFLRAERSDRWPPEELARFAALPQDSPVHLSLLANSGHWLHVDNPEGTIAWMGADFE